MFFWKIQFLGGGKVFFFSRWIHFLGKKNCIFCFVFVFLKHGIHRYSTQTGHRWVSAQCGSLPTPSCQGSFFLCACIHNAFRSKGGAVTLNLRLSCSTIPGVLLLCFISKQTTKKRNPVCWQWKKATVFFFRMLPFCVCWSCSHFSTKRKGELK